MDNNPMYPIKGTTILGLTCEDGIVIAGDMQVTQYMSGYVAHKLVKKVNKLADNIIGGFTGLVADAQTLFETVRARIKLLELDEKRQIKVKIAANILSSILFNMRRYPFYLEALIGGIDDDGTHLFSLDMVGSILEEKFLALGPGATIAYGLLEERYDDNITINDGIKLATESLISAYRRNALTGNVLQIMSLHEDGSSSESITTIT
ncbi:MAG: hypothetical protein ACP6IU_12545 [Candidatus Asgardarchaeia archaeon]